MTMLKAKVTFQLDGSHRQLKLHRKTALNYRGDIRDFVWQKDPRGNKLLE